MRHTADQQEDREDMDTVQEDNHEEALVGSCIEVVHVVLEVQEVVHEHRRALVGLHLPEDNFVHSGQGDHPVDQQ